MTEQHTSPSTSESSVLSLDLSRKPVASGPMPSLVGMDMEELKAALLSIGVDAKKVKMRASQLWHWIYHAGVQDFDAITNMAKDLRADMAKHFTLARPEVVERQISKDGTRKWLLRSAPGIEIETVFIPDVAGYGALCISSQVGCTLNCTFCHTGTQKLVRNLTHAEIIAQIMVARDDLEDWPSAKLERKLTNLVFMGMGEPLYNLENVTGAIDIISDPEGLSIGRRRVTVSTSGVVPEMAELGEKSGAMLAVSLHAARDELRDILVPINKKYPLNQLMAAIRAYPGLNNAKRVTFEYVMLKGVNDSDKDARDLVKLIAGIPAKINLIPFNPWPGTEYECSSPERIKAFGDIVNRAGYASPVRRPRGRDILAACGQLKSESEKIRASTLRKEREEAGETLGQESDA